MAIGPGKYDDLATTVREQAHADGVVVIVIGGDKGNSFCVQADLPTTLLLPDLLENLAKQIRDDLESR
jgi:enoyl-CoA hydratase/carnithine racemase